VQLPVREEDMHSSGGLGKKLMALWRDPKEIQQNRVLLAAIIEACFFLSFVCF
jgi:hypothetical protein